MNDSLELAGKVVLKDYRRMWIWGIACIIAWMLVVMLPWATTMPLLAKLAEHRDELVNANTPATGEDTLFMMQVRQAVIFTFLCSIVSMFAAAICTVAYITVSRRVTMRQVSRQLAEISAQLNAIGERKG